MAESFESRRDEIEIGKLLMNAGGTIQIRRIEKYFSRQGMLFELSSIVMRDDEIFAIYVVGYCLKQFELFVTVKGKRFYSLKKEGCEVCYGANQKEFLREFRIFKKYGTTDLCFSFP